MSNAKPDLGVYWNNLVTESEKLVEASKGDDFAFVGVLQAKSVIAANEELCNYRVKVLAEAKDALASYDQRLVEKLRAIPGPTRGIDR